MKQQGTIIFSEDVNRTDNMIYKVLVLYNIVQRWGSKRLEIEMYFLLI